VKENFSIKRLKITGIIAETANAKTFILEPLDGWQPEYSPGQFLTLVFYTRHGEKRRSYSISSAATEPLSITIKKVDNGEFSRLLTSHAKPGDILFTAGISGMFLLPVNLHAVQLYFFIAAGSGITPCFSMIKTILATCNSDIVLIYSNRSEEDTIFLIQLKELQQQYQNRFTIVFLFSNIYDVERSRLSNWLLNRLLDKYLKAPAAHALFYLCGPFDYMRMVNITLLNHVPAQNIFKENFSTLPRLLVPKPPDTDAHVARIHINGETYQLLVQYPQSILAAAKANKIFLPYSCEAGRCGSCEAGRCGSCVANCISGKVWMAYNGVLTDEEIEKGRVLLCQGYPVGGDVEIAF